MTAKHTSLTTNQKEAIMAARNEQGRVINGMAKWNVEFSCGTGCTMLSDQCSNREEAIYAAVERFGGKVVNVK